MKARAPPPPPAPQPAPRRIFRNTEPDGGGMAGGDAKENMLRPTVEIRLTLPQGHQATVTEDGSKALMDLLVELCSRYHLNPSLHTLELLTPDGQPLGFKPNALLGSLNVACILIKEKVWEEKVVRRPAPKVPEKTVRLMVNYHGSQKAVIRVNPLVPLQALVPVICDKCELDPAHVLLLKDGTSRQELPIDKSLAQLEIKELYVLDQSLALQPKMASAPALNYSESIRSSTTSLNRAEKKGLLGLFQFSRKKSKTEATSMDMNDTDDKVVQNTETHSSGLSTVSMVPCVDARPSTLGQSQSITNITRLSPKTETKKRRAPAPPGAPIPTLGHSSIESCQMGLGSESQRKKKAPAPPPTPLSITLGPDDASTSAAPTSDSHAIDTPTPALRTKAVQSITVSSSTVVTQKTNLASGKTTVQPTPVCTATLLSSSPSSSSTTVDSLAVQDSSSEFSHNLNDSGADPDQASFQSSTTSNSTVGASAPTEAQLVMTSSTPSARLEQSEQASRMAEKTDQQAASISSSKSETESALNLKLEEVENNRQSAIGTTERPAPAKPRRSPALSSSPTEPTENNFTQSPMEVEEAAPQSWLHSKQISTPDAQNPETDTPEEETLSVGSSSGSSSLPDQGTPEEETLSVGSSSGSSSLPDQGYAASEGMAEGEDSGLVSSPSDTQPTSPDGSLSLDRNSRGGGERLGPVRDNSSDSDEGCATWGSRCRHNGISPEVKNSYNEDPELTAQLHQALADFEADLADMSHTHIISAKSPYTLSTDSNDVPVSVVDMDVPVTAIDEVLEDYGYNTIENEEKPQTGTELAGSKGPDPCHQSSLEQNKNNNACTVGDSNRSSSANTTQPPKPAQHSKSLKNKSVSGKVEDKIQTKAPDAQNKEMGLTDTNTVKEAKQITLSAVKSHVDVQKHSENSQMKHDPLKSNIEKKSILPPAGQKSSSIEQDKEKHRVNLNKSSTSTSYGKITCNFTSRFGTKTFTVVPSKPSVMHAATEKPAVTLTPGAIKIDDQGNMVKVGIPRNKFDGSSESGINCSEGAPLLGKAKAFWSSTEKQESAGPPSKTFLDKVKESTDNLKNTHNAISEITLKTNKTEGLKTTTKPEESAQSNERVEEKAKEQVKAISEVTKEERVEVESKVALPKLIQQPSIKPVLPPPFLPDQNRDLSFLRPSRRTSSQYVASAITKYTPKTVAKPSNSPDVPEPSVSLKNSFSFQKAGRSMHINPHHSSRSSVSNNETDSGFKSHPSGPKRSMSYPEYISDRQRAFEEVRQDMVAFESCVGPTKGSCNMVEREEYRNKDIQSSSSSQINANGDRNNMKCIQARSPSPTQNIALQSSAKLPAAVKPVCQDQINTTRGISNTAAHQTSHAKPEPPVTVSSGVLPEPQQVTVFGPVKKFRPVICKSVPKETSLHSSLMEAIQTGGGKDRLKKMSTSGPSSLKKPSVVEEENERSALLAAIRAQSISGRLRKTKSEAASELEKFRKTSEEESKPEHPSSPSPLSVSCTSPPLSPPPPIFSPPPPLPPMAAPPPPPPPPVSPQGKPSIVVLPSGTAHMDPALAREAMLEAIRSGSAAERLKKITAPTKTVQVNSRLGTIQATSSTLSQH
ncbi:hypothetical protein LDENG_00084770 [Lucifuga dentata]|nr:hypothetical protein LDENG_00084770 [Lucifuga dentata]